MSERTTEVTKFMSSNEIIIKQPHHRRFVVIPEEEIDAIMEDIKNLR